MNFIERIQRSWQLFKTTLSVVSTNKRLLWFPFATSLISVLLFAFFFAVPILAFVLQATGHSWFEAAHWNTLAVQLKHPHEIFARLERPENAVILSVVTTAYITTLYFTSMFAATFCNVAFYSAIMKALAGETVSIRAGFAFAAKRTQSILFWSLFAGSVGLLIKMIAERLGFIGSIIMRFVGLAWSVAAVFVIPIIIREDCRNPIQLLKTSASTLKQTWGESLVGYVGMGAISSMIALSTIAGILLSVVVGVLLGSPLWIIPGVLLSILFAIASGILLHVVEQIYRCALYIYASEGVVPEPYDADLLNAAWKIKKA